MTITIGPPIAPEELASTGGAEAATDLIMTSIASMLPASARGYYADLAQAAEGVPA